MVFSVYPMLQAPILDYILKLEWKSFVLVYRRDLIYMKMNDVLEFALKKNVKKIKFPIKMKIIKIFNFFSSNSVELVTIDLDGFHDNIDESKLGEVIWGVSCSGKRNFVIDMSYSKIDETFTRFKTMGLMTPNFNYLILDTDIHQDIYFGQKYSRGGANITAIEIVSKVTEKKGATFLERVATDTIELLYRGFENYHKNSPNHGSTTRRKLIQNANITCTELQIDNQRTEGTVS